MLLRIFCIAFVRIIVGILSVASLSGGNPYTRLARDLLSDYEVLSLPVQNASDVLSLEFSICLHRIDDMNEKEQIISLTVFVVQKWHDHYLSWNPEDYDGITELRMPADKIWVPDTTVLNSSQDSNGLIHSDTNVIISHSGHVLWISPFNLQKRCTFRIKYIPYDTQVCDVQFSSWSYGKSHLQFTNTSVHLEHFQDHGAWVLLKADISPQNTMTSHNPFEMSGAALTLVLQRRPKFGILFTIVPFILIATLSLFIFLIPVDSGEKLSFGVTNLLTLIMFYSEISSSIQSTANGEFPILGTFFFSVICLVLASCLLSVLVLHIHHRKQPASVLVKRIFFGRLGLHRFVWYIPKVKEGRSLYDVSSCGSNLAKNALMFGFPTVPSSATSTPLMHRKISAPSDATSQLLSDLESNLGRALLGIQRIEGRLQDKEDSHDEYRYTTWHKIAVVMDQLFFITLTTVFATMLFSFFMISVWNHDNQPAT